uniref:Hexosyltransferase n=1 Tax=Aureoumbra lagunensis TaxID=44058 RepID=A0A7S3JQB9_9STRA|mmetsp:Transcript_13885/g.20830  ORF Transcript_13885/g.20830 Transcript_13885/m.20830 type:complete len:481 (+) Transcript_13885:22-1464(+)
MRSPTAGANKFRRRLRLCAWSTSFVAIVWGLLILRTAHKVSHQKAHITGSVLGTSIQSSIEKTPRLERRNRWAVAALLSTRPSSKSDGWKPRSVTAGNGTACQAGRSLCAVLVLGESLRRYGDIQADFVVMVDNDASPSFLRSLAAHGAVPIRMHFNGFPVFEQYILFRKLYVFALVQYERVLLLDIDGVITGSLRFLFESSMSCVKPIAPPSVTQKDTPCLPVDAASTCQGNQAEILAQQTSGTPILTAYFMVRPNTSTWESVGKELTLRCGRADIVCDRSTIYSLGWGGYTAPHNWATRAAAPNRSFKQGHSLSWADMGAGFSDQGFVEYFFALKRKTALLISKWSCAKRLHYLHFNVPPKPWNCPDHPTCAAATGATIYKWDSPVASRAWGGHHCARDWWWQYTLARPVLGAAAGNGEHSCLSTCLNQLDHAFLKRGEHSPASLYRDYIPGPRCAHLWPNFDRRRQLKFNNKKDGFR